MILGNLGNLSHNWSNLLTPFQGQLAKITDNVQKMNKSALKWLSIYCGTKAADAQDNFLACELKCKSTEYFGAFATTIAPQCPSIQSVAPSATVWLQLKGALLSSPIFGD